MMVVVEILGERQNNTNTAYVLTSFERISCELLHYNEKIMYVYVAAVIGYK